MVHSNTEPNWRTGSENCDQSVGGTEEIKPEHPLGLAGKQNVLQIFTSQWPRSWTTTKAQLHLEKETRHSYKLMSAPRATSTMPFLKDRGRERWAQTLFLLLPGTSCFFDTRHEDQETREMETGAMLTPKSCCFAVGKGKFPEEWIPQGNKRFLIRVRLRPAKGSGSLLSKLTHEHQFGWKSGQTAICSATLPGWKKRTLTIILLLDTSVTNCFNSWWVNPS